MEKREKKEMEFKTISLQKVKKMLGYTGKGFRSVIRWCTKKKITVFGDGRRRRILESDWIKTQQKDFIHSIKLAYPSTWMKELKRRGIQLIAPAKTPNQYQAQSSEAIKLLKEWDDE